MNNDSGGVDHRVQAGHVGHQVPRSCGNEGLSVGSRLTAQDGLARSIQGRAQRVEGKFTSILLHQAGNRIHLEKFIHTR